MNAIRKVSKYLQKNPGTANSKALARLAASLAEEQSYPLDELYRLDIEAFDLAIDLLQDWRIDRYYAARLHLLDSVLVELPGAAVVDAASKVPVPSRHL